MANILGDPIYIWYALALLNALSFAAYALDKLLSILKWRRISERNLILLSLFFGGVGALLAMLTCRHKIRKPKFWVFVTLSIIVQCAAIVLLYNKGKLF